MTKPYLSFIIPSVRTEKWPAIYESLQKSCTKSPFELIFIGPTYNNNIDNLKNVKFVRDYGCPSRALQIGSLIAEGEVISCGSDDGVFIENKMDEVINIFQTESLTARVFMNLVYSEGDEWLRGNDEKISATTLYYTCHHHNDLKQAGIDPNQQFGLFFLMYTADYRYLGGIDCRMEHINSNLIDLSLRAQKIGMKLVHSPHALILECQYGRTVHTSAVINAYFNNDLPLFTSIYSTKESADKRPNLINYDNWQQADTVWARA